MADDARESARESREVDRQALRDLAESRLRFFWQRSVMYLSCFAIGAVFASPLGALVLIGLMIVAEAVEARAARALLGASGGAEIDAIGARLWVSNVGTAAAAALAIAGAWIFTAAEYRVYPLCFLFAASLYGAMNNQQVHALIMVRQGIYVGMALGLAVADLLMSGTGGPTWEAFALKVLPVIAFAYFTLIVSHWSARQYRERLAYAVALSEARATAERATAARDGFMATVSHELRTPLSGITGIAQILERKAPEHAQELGIITEAGSILSQLLDELLDHAKLEERRLELDPRPDRPRAVVDYVVGLYAPSAREKGLAVTSDIAGHVPETLVFDGRRLRQCLSNLVSNALKFTDRGEIRIALGAEPLDGDRTRLTFCVTDTGIGMSPAELATLFDPYSQGGADVARRYGGTGLGLSITRRLAEMMGGGVRVESHRGRGSSFTLSILAREPGPGEEAEMP